MSIYSMFPTNSDNLFKSDKPSRHIIISSKSTFNLQVSKEELLKDIQLNTNAEIRLIYQYLNNTLLLSFYSLKHAELALNYLANRFTNFYNIYYAKPCCINKNLNEKLFVILKSTVNQDIDQYNYMNHLLRIDRIYSISKTLISPNCMILNLEFDDERSSDLFIKTYNQLIIDGVQFNAYLATNDQFLCTCHQSIIFNNNIYPMKTANNTSYSFFTNNDHILKSPPVKENSSISTTSSASSISTTSTTVSHSSMENMIINDIDLEKVNHGQDKRTTFMIRNIPNKYTQQMLIDCINSTHQDTFDFIYLPIDFQNKCNVGYAFINFTDPKTIVSFAKERVGKKWKHFNSDKKLSLSYANIQGKKALIKKFKNSNVMSVDVTYRPKIFYSSGPNKGKEQDFPKPDPQQKQK